MNKTKRMLSLLTSVAMAASAFSALVIPASAAETPVQTTLQHTAMFKIMARETDPTNQIVYELDGAETYANMLEKNDWVSTALMQFSIDDEEVDFSKVSSATLVFKGTNVHTTNTSTLSVYSTGNADYDAGALDINSLYNISGELGTANSGTTGVTINTEGALGGVTEICKLPELAGGFSDTITADITDYIKGLSAGTKVVSLAVSNSNRGVTIPGKGATNVDDQPKLNIVLSDEVTYEANIKTNAYAKVTTGDNTYYADGSGLLTIEGLTDGTSVDYTISKTGYNSKSGNITISGDDAAVEEYLVPSDENVLYTENFDDIGVDAKGTLFNYANSGGTGTAGLRYNNGGMEFFSTGNGSRSGWFSFTPAIDASVAGAYKISFDLSDIYMSQDKSGEFTSEIDFVDSNDNVIFGIIPTFTTGKVSTGLQVKAGEDVKTITTEDLGSKTLHIDAEIKDGTVTVTVGGYEPVILTQAAETGNVITGMKNINSRYIFSTLDNIVVSKVIEEETPETTEPTESEDPETTEPTEPEEPAEEPSEAKELINEDFSSTTGTWGFEGNGGAAVDETNGYLIINSNNKNGATTVKTLDDNVKSAEALNIKFDWASDVEAGKDRNSAFELRDDSGVLLFAMYGKGGSKTDSGIKFGLVDGTWNDIESHTRGKWFTVELGVNFMMGTMTYKITDKAAGTELKSGTVDITAKNLATMTGNDIWSLAPQWIDNVVISTPATYAVTVTVTDGDAAAVEGATVSVVGSDTTAVTNAEGKATLILGAGNYTISVTKSGYAIASETVEVTGTTEKSVTMEYVGEPVATTIEIAGGDEYLYQPKSGEEKKSVNAYTATVYDQTGQVMPDASVTWSLAGNPAGASIDQSGIITLTDAYSVTDINGADLTVVATAGEASANEMIHVRQAQILSGFEIEGPNVIKYGQTSAYSIVNAVDQYGNPYGYTDLTYELTATNATVDGMNVTATETDTQVSDIVITAKSSNDVTKALTVTGYGYDFYEPGVGSATYAEDARMIDINGENVIAWPVAPGTTYINLPEPVELTPGSAKLIRFKLAETTQSLVSQARTLDFQNKDGVSVLSDGKLYNPNGQLGFNPTYEDKMYGWGEGSKYVGDIGAAGLSTWVDCQILIKTANDGTASVIVDVGGKKVETGIATVDSGDGTQVPVTEISRIELYGATGIPEARNLAIKDIIISDSDIAEVEVSGDDQIAKIEGHVATKAYRGAVYTTVDGEKFTWSVSGEGTTGGAATEVTKAVFTLNEAAKEDMTAVAVYPVYTDDVLTSLTLKDVEIKTGDTTVSVDADKDDVVYLWDSLQGMKPLAAQATIETETTEGSADITIDQNGVLSVKDTAKAGTVVTIRYESSASTEDAPRYAEKQVTINDFAAVESFEIDGPAAVNAGDAATYKAVNIIDEYGDEVEMNAVYAITEGSDIASIDPATGVMTTTADNTGDVVVSVTVGNSGKTTTLTKDVYVGAYSTSGTTSENSVEVDVTKIANYDANTDYYVTTAKDGVIVNQYETKSTDGKVTVDTTGADSYEVSPIYFFDSVGNVSAGKEIALADGYYDFTFTKANGTRADIFVNGIMVGQNVDQYGAGRSTSGSEYTVTDVKVSGGSAVVTMKDNTSEMKSIRVKKAPTIVERKTHLYILGDSLVATYYGTYAVDGEGVPAPGDAQTGWGQQLENFIGDDVNVTNLAESGSDSLGILNTTYQSVIALSEPGDYVILECGYNDADTNSHNVGSTANMKKYVTQMVGDFREAGITPILVTPNASRHDYKEGVKWSGALLEAAEENDVFAVDLSKESYNFLYSLYGDDMDAVGMNFNLYINGATPDNWLHTSYVGAMKYAEIVAQGIADLQAANATAGENGEESLAGLTIDKSFTFSFEDTKGNTINMQVK